MGPHRLPEELRRQGPPQAAEPAPGAARPGVSDILALQRSAGNAAVTRMLASGAPRQSVARDITDDLVAGATSLASQAYVAGVEGPLVSGALAADDFLSRPPGSFQQPYDLPLELPRAMRTKAWLQNTLPGVASAKFGSAEVGSIWSQFLMGGTMRRRSYRGDSNAIVQGFANSRVTVEAHRRIFEQAVAALAARPPSLQPGQEARVSIVELLGNPRVSINFSYPFDIPGHLAGGEGSGGGGADTREVRGDVIVRMDAQGAVTATSDFTYIVNDTVDFVPGDSGGGLEEVLTIPLSRLEATGPSWANDVPFDVEFKPPPITRPLAGGPHPEDPARQSGPRERGAL